MLSGCGGLERKNPYDPASGLEVDTEELLIGSNVSGTGHPRIMRADEDCLTMDELSDLLDELKQASQDLDYDKARDILLTAVKEYDPQRGIDDLVWLRKAATEATIGTDRVVDFPGRPKVT